MGLTYMIPKYEVKLHLLLCVSYHIYLWKYYFMLLFLGTGKSLQRILLAPVKIPTQEHAENQTDSESTSNSILCLHYYKLCCPTLWWGEGDSLKCQKISGKKRKTGPNHCRLNSFFNVHKNREKFFSRWFLSSHIIILSHEHGHGFIHCVVF